MADQEDVKYVDYNEMMNLRHERFKALGGGQDIQRDLSDLSKRNLLADQITDLHRKIVFDLAAGGLSNQDVADVMGVSKERLQTLFKQELASAYQLCHSSLARSLYYLGISGDGRAAADWLRLHNRSKWATKTQLSGSEDGAPIKTEDSGAREVLNKLLAGMSTDKKLTRPPSTKSSPAPTPTTASTSPAKRAGSSSPKSIKRPRNEKTE
jgi:AraC-like DNA-binding protein